jgi:hypothetical protein
MGEDDKVLVEFLKERGHTEEEIAKITKSLAQHDTESARESIFDSIAAGTFNIDDIIKKALAEE